MKNYSILIFIVLLLVSCGGNKKTDISQSVTDFDGDVEQLLTEAMDPIISLANIGAPLSDFRLPVSHLAEVVTSIVEHSPMVDDQILARHTASFVSSNLMEGLDVEDTLQMRFYADSILMPLSRASHHWYKSEVALDDQSTTVMAGYSFHMHNDEEYLYSSIVLYFAKEAPICIVTFPLDMADYPALHFLMLDALNGDSEPIATLTVNDVAHSMQDEEGAWMFYFPLETVLPLLEQSDLVMLSYTTADSTENAQPYILEEFHAQLAAIEE